MILAKHKVIRKGFVFFILLLLQNCGTDGVGEGAFTTTSGITITSDSNDESLSDNNSTDQDNSSTDQEETSDSSPTPITSESIPITISNTKIPTLVFQKTIKRPDSTDSGQYEETPSEIIITKDGDYVGVGRSISSEWPPPNNVDDALIFKLSADGELLWNQVIHYRNYDRATSVVEGNDGDYYLTGFTSQDDADKSDILFSKVSSGGEVLLKKSIKITKNYDGGYAISKTTDGNYVIAGEAGSSHNEDFLILRVDGEGSTIWKKRFQDPEDTSAYDVIQASDGSYYLIGTKRIIHKYEDIRVIKINSKGKKVWDKNYGGDRVDVGEGIVEAEDNTFILAGSTYSYGTGGDVLLLKIDSDGEVLWTKNFGGNKQDQLRDVDGNTVSGRHITKTPDGGVLVSGYTSSYDGNPEDPLCEKNPCQGGAYMWVFKIDTSGNLLWQYIHPGDGGTAFSAKQGNDGSVVIFGSSFPTGTPPDGSSSYTWGSEDLLVVKIQ